MGFSLRYRSFSRRTWRSQSGQGILEYTLVLVVSVSIILGGIYQLNDAFRVWAKNYFGDYLACLLETGELPNIDGNPGDPGICNQLFKPFSLKDGRPLLTASNGGGNGNGGGGSGPSGGARENQRTGPSGASGSYTDVGAGLGFNAFHGGANGGGSSSADDKGNSIYTGSTQAGDYGGGYNSDSGSNGGGLRYRLDTRFAFEDDSKKPVERTVSSVAKVPKQNSGQANRTIINRKDMSHQENMKDTPLTFGNFMRFLIIAAIIIALVMFLGGQALNISKSME